MSLLLELEVSKDEVSSLHSQARKDKEAMEEDYQKALEQIFAYGYGCYAFKHNICGGLLGILDGMPDFADSLPPEFFMNPRYPLGPNSRRSQGYRGTSRRSDKGFGGDVVVEEHG